MGLPGKQVAARARHLANWRVRLPVYRRLSITTMLQEIDELKKKYCPELYIPDHKVPMTERVRMVLEHINDRPRTRAAQVCGVSIGTFYRIVRKYGGEMRHELANRNPEHVELVRKWFPTMSGLEMQRRFGIRKGRAEKIARELGVKHTPETLQRFHEKAVYNLTHDAHNRDYMRGARKRKRMQREDELRVSEGKPQLTRLKVRKMPGRIYRIKWYLKNKYDYFDVEDELYTLGYDKRTRRCVNEAYYIERYGFKFMEAEE